MRVVARVSINCGDVGRRVTVRYRLPSGSATDVVGILETCDDASFGVRDKRDALREVARSEVIAARLVGPATPRTPR